MSFLAVAEKDFRDAIRSRLIIGVTILFVAVTGGGIGLAEIFDLPAEGVLALIQFVLIRGITFIAPVIAIGIAYRSIAGERESGSLKVLLSLPNSRRDIVIGKFLGRFAVVGIAVTVGFLALLVGAPIAYSTDIPIETILAFLVMTLILSMVFVSITVGISALYDSTFAAAIASTSVFILFRVAWRGVIEILRWVANGFDYPGAEPIQNMPNWARFIHGFNPLNGFRNANDWLLSQVSSEFSEPSGAEAFYLEPWFGFVILAFWIVVPLVAGYIAFEYADL